MMMMMRRRLACCTWDREITLDFDDQERVMTYNGLETIIINSQSYENESGTTDSLDEDDSSCSSSNNASGSFSSHWHMSQKDEWEVSYSPQHLHVKEKPANTTQFLEVEIMKERFAKLLLGDDITGGCKGISTALALSNAISNLSATVFGELWKLEPLPEERKSKWRREMDWLLSPTKYMIELVPAKQNGTNGRTLEIMTPKTRADIQMNLPALQKLDSMLTETLDSMVDTEFWYADGGSRGEGRNRGMRQSKRWWLPSPQVPTSGLSDIERKKLLSQGKIVHQVLKAAKSINEAVLLEMPIPDIIKDALPMSGKASLGEELYRILSSETISTEEMLKSLNLKSDNHALNAINRLETAIFAWKKKITEQESGRSPVRTSWSFMKDPISELDKMEFLLKRSEALLQHIKTRYPNLPQTFLDVAKIQYGKDIGHSILEAYSRVLGNLALSILSRIGDILQEDVLSNPNSPVATCNFPGMNITGNSDTPMLGERVRRTLIDHLNKVDGQFCESNASNIYDLELSSGEIKTNSVTQTPSCSRVWCIGRETCSSFSPKNSP